MREARGVVGTGALNVIREASGAGGGAVVKCRACVAPTWAWLGRKDRGGSGLFAGVSVASESGCRSSSCISTGSSSSSSSSSFVYTHHRRTETCIAPAALRRARSSSFAASRECRVSVLTLLACGRACVALAACAPFLPPFFFLSRSTANSKASIPRTWSCFRAPWAYGSLNTSSKTRSCP